MNYFLTLIILLVCGGAYYEHTQQEQEAAGAQKEMTELHSQLDALQATNKQLADEKTALEKTVADAQAKNTALATEIEALKKAALPPAPPVTLASGPTAPPPPNPNNLGTITTLAGKTYPDCKLLRVGADGITISCADGITKILFNVLPLAMQAHFGYDPASGPGLDPDQVSHQETLRLSASAQASR